MLKPEDVHYLEVQRLHLQTKLDASKTQEERNRLGQFATPPALAIEILERASMLLEGDRKQIHFLDPAFGTGAFYSALLKVFPTASIQAHGYDIDTHYGNPAQRLWRDTPLILTLGDFTQATPPQTEAERVNLLICNPPYVRHHHLPPVEKIQLQTRVQHMINIHLSGLTGLYGYFLLLGHAWLREGGLAGWLIPAEFMDVNYGVQLKHYLTTQVRLIEIQRFDTSISQFEDALVSSALVWFRKEHPSPHQEVSLRSGGTVSKPEIIKNVALSQLKPTIKWAALFTASHRSNPASSQRAPKIKLIDLFTIKRGIATGANRFFILTPEKISRYEIPHKFLQPILPSPRYIPSDEIEADQIGNPKLARRLFLLVCDQPEDRIRDRWPMLWAYLETGIQQGIHKRYLCRHRSPWYAQEHRPSAPFLFPYMGRRNANGDLPFRFILNHSKATAPNVYLMLYPKPTLAKAIQQHSALLESIWRGLNSISDEILLKQGRVYGGGLHKLEPCELANTSAERLAAYLPESVVNAPQQLPLFT